MVFLPHLSTKSCWQGSVYGSLVLSLYVHTRRQQHVCVCFNLGEALVVPYGAG